MSSKPREWIISTTWGGIIQKKKEGKQIEVYLRNEKVRTSLIHLRRCNVEINIRKTINHYKRWISWKISAEKLNKNALIYLKSQFILKVSTFIEGEENAWGGSGWEGGGGVVGNKKIKKGKVEMELYRKSHANFEQWSITLTKVKQIHTNNHVVGLEPHSKNLLKYVKRTSSNPTS